jgi:hypothetical protein
MGHGSHRALGHQLSRGFFRFAAVSSRNPQPLLCTDRENLAAWVEMATHDFHTKYGPEASVTSSPSGTASVPTEHVDPSEAINRDVD